MADNPLTPEQLQEVVDYVNQFGAFELPIDAALRLLNSDGSYGYAFGATDAAIDLSFANVSFVNEQINAAITAGGDTNIIEQIATAGGDVLAPMGADKRVTLPDFQLALSTTQLTNIAAVTTIQTDLTALTNRVTTAEGNISSQGTRLTTAEGNITSVTTRVTTAEGEIDNLQMEQTSQGTRITTNEGDITDIQTEIGEDTDAADEDGSIYARLAQLNDDLDNVDTNRIESVEFTLTSGQSTYSHSENLGSDVEVYRNGVGPMPPTTFSITGTTITLLDAGNWQTGDCVTVKFIVVASPDSVSSDTAAAYPEVDFTGTFTLVTGRLYGYFGNLWQWNGVETSITNTNRVANAPLASAANWELILDVERTVLTYPETFTNPFTLIPGSIYVEADSYDTLQPNEVLYAWVGDRTDVSDSADLTTYAPVITSDDWILVRDHNPLWVQGFRYSSGEFVATIEGTLGEDDASNRRGLHGYVCTLDHTSTGANAPVITPRPTWSSVDSTMYPAGTDDGDRLLWLSSDEATLPQDLRELEQHLSIHNFPDSSGTASGIIIAGQQTIAGEGTDDIDHILFHRGRISGSTVYPDDIDELNTNFASVDDVVDVAVDYREADSGQIISVVNPQDTQVDVGITTTADVSVPVGPIDVTVMLSSDLRKYGVQVMSGITIGTAPIVVTAITANSVTFEHTLGTLDIPSGSGVTIPGQSLEMFRNGDRQAVYAIPKKPFTDYPTEAGNYHLTIAADGSSSYTRDVPPLTFVASDAQIPTTPVVGQTIRTTGPILFQLTYGMSDGVTGSTPPAVGDPVLFASFASAGATTTGTDVVFNEFTDGGLDIHNTQINFENDTSGDPSTTSGRFRLSIDGGTTSISVNDAGHHIWSRETATDDWVYYGETTDSSPNGHEGRIRIVAVSAAAPMAVNPGFQMGYSTAPPGALTTLATNTTFAWNGAEWVAI